MVQHAVCSEMDGFPVFYSNLPLISTFCVRSCHTTRYLQEVGYTDTILDVRSQRVRALLGLSGPEQNGAQDAKNIEQLLNGRDILAINSKDRDSKRNGDKSRQESMAVLEKFDFLRADASDEEDEPFGVGHNSSKKPKVVILHQVLLTGAHNVIWHCMTTLKLCYHL
uniref:Uncharacterized protein n=1 Tax=Eptatretus burgeri TaxID=7764 RepID=A0A8C4N5E3_EPTBU